MNFNVFYFLLLSVIGGTFSATIPVTGGQLPGIGNGIEGTTGGFVETSGDGGTGNVFGSVPGLNSAAKTVSGLGEQIGNAVAQRSIQNPLEESGVKIPNLLQGFGNGLGETGNVFGSLPGLNSAAKTVSGLGEQIGNAVAQRSIQNPLEQSGINIPNLLQGLGNGLGGTGNVLGSLPGVNSVVKTVGGLGQGIENAVGKQLIEKAAETGLNTVHQYENRVLKTIEDFFGGLFNTGDKGGQKGLFPKTAENSLHVMQGVGNGLLSQVENAIERIGGGGNVPKIGG